MTKRALSRPKRPMRLGKALTTAALMAFALAMLFPFAWMLSASFKKPLDIYQYPIVWFPNPPQVSNYVKIWNNPIYPFFTFFLNSVKVAGLACAGALTISSMAAYAFTKIDFPGRNALFMALLATLMIPQHITLVPRFILFSWLGIYNTHLALILPSMFNMIGIFLLRQFYMAVPMELSEAAMIDGAGHGRIWLTVIMPLTKTAMASLVILTFVWSWNEYVNPIIFLTDKRLYTIPVGLQCYKDNEEIQYTLIMAAATLAIVPVVGVFLAGQRYFIQGIAVSGIKG